MSKIVTIRCNPMSELNDEEHLWAEVESTQRLLRSVQSTTTYLLNLSEFESDISAAFEAAIALSSALENGSVSEGAVEALRVAKDRLLDIHAKTATSRALLGSSSVSESDDDTDSSVADKESVPLHGFMKIESNNVIGSGSPDIVDLVRRNEYKLMTVDDVSDQNESASEMLLKVRRSASNLNTMSSAAEHAALAVALQLQFAQAENGEIRLLKQNMATLQAENLSLKKRETQLNESAFFAQEEMFAQLSMLSARWPEYVFLIQPHIHFQ